MKNERYETMRLRHLGIDTYKEAVIYLPVVCPICKSEGFEVHTRVIVSLRDRTIIATINNISNGLLESDEAGLSNYAWEQLKAKEGDIITIRHMLPLISMDYVRAKMYGHPLRANEFSHIIQDITKGYYSDIEISAFLTACSGGRLNLEEIADLTRAMVEGGSQLKWASTTVVDKHCVGGLPGNRTSLIVVPIVASFGLIMPKTSSRAITSPAGTADTMEVLAPVDIGLAAMRKIVDKENGCIVWSGSVPLSPADDFFISVERILDIDSEGQLIASVLSKKIAAGSTHIVIDMPVGPTAKIRSHEMARMVKGYFEAAAHKLGINLSVYYSDGRQPVGRGIGPALEARDVLQVLQRSSNAPQDLRERALGIAGHILEFSPITKKGEGRLLAENILESGQAWEKFLKICEAQGGFREPTFAKYQHLVSAPYDGKVCHIDNRKVAKVAKLAGAPNEKTAGIDFHTPLDKVVSKGEPLFTIHANSKNQLSYALDYLNKNADTVKLARDEYAPEGSQ